jgi:hypothetical protein
MIKTNDGYEMRSEQGFGEKVSYFHTSTDALNINLSAILIFILPQFKLIKFSIV